jgi:hypothetical protein
VDNGNSSAGGVFLPIYTGDWDILQSSTSYRVSINFSVISLGITHAHFADLDGATTVRFIFNSAVGSYTQTLNITPNITMGTLVIAGTITTPNLTIYNLSTGTIQIDAGWTNTNTGLNLYTAGQIFFEEVN